MNLVDISESATVTRWHSANCHRYPSIAEHSFLVTMYAKELLKQVHPDATQNDELLVINHALHHDLAETVCGDLGTPFKRALEKKCQDLNIGNPIEDIEDKVCPSAKLHREACDDFHYIIVKLADILDAIKFISVEGKGASAPKILKERKNAYRQYVDKGVSLHPEYEWNSAHKILDDLLDGTPTEIDFVEIIPN
ncbi:YfbR-like 5'-deoxynucleotidase [Vibrio owensii]|uniref:YfbR-like 5'-deoxynucleotidase n=1 Tax=Vibrio harveyi group TaxID=717610 RepID=UPI003CC5E0AB